MDVQAGMIREPEARARPGFTLVELVIVILIGGVLGSIAMPPIGSYLEGRRSVQARDAFIMTAARARAAAVGEGDFVLMTVSTSGDSVVSVSQSTGETLDVLRLYSGRTAADIAGSGDFTLCYTSRGFAHPRCRDGANLPDSISFTSGDNTVWARITLGRVVAP